jgi:peptidoglycan-N-acetylglucosamine deacetylase
LDLDNEWSYLKTHGDSGWETFPTYLDVIIPRALSIFESFDVKVSFFVVGQDALIDQNKGSLRSIAIKGHEICNHSFSHEPWLHLYPTQKVEEEIDKAEEAIENATGVPPVGFRGPGYCLSADVLRVLARRGYLFDASTLPSFLGPLGRAYYFMRSRLDHVQRQQRQMLFGSLKDGLRPIDPYLWQIGETSLLEIPVTTLPGLRIPFHLSYILYLSTFSPRAARAYFQSALRLCRLAGTEPSILMHPLDLLGKDDVSTLGFFPGMNLDSETKRQRVYGYLSDLQSEFKILPLGQYARQIRDRPGLGLRPVDNFPESNSR